MTDREERQHVIEVLKQMRLDYEDFWEENDTEEIKAFNYAISSIETDLKYDLMYEGAPKTKSVTIKQLEEMYTKFEQKLWREREDVRGDDMIEVGYAEQFLQDLLAEFGCWDEEVEE